MIRAFFKTTSISMKTCKAKASLFAAFDDLLFLPSSFCDLLSFILTIRPAHLIMFSYLLIVPQYKQTPAPVSSRSHFLYTSYLNILIIQLCSHTNVACVSSRCYTFLTFFLNLFIMSYLPRSTPSVRSTVLPGSPALHARQNKHQSAYIQL